MLDLSAFKSQVLCLTVLIKMTLMKKISIIAGLFLVGLTAYFAVSMAMELYNEKQEAEKLTAVASDFSSFCLEEHGIDQSDHSAVLSQLRECVYKNSQYKMDEEFYRHWKDPVSIKTQRVLDFAKGKTDTPPHMECSIRTEILKGLYRTMGYKVKPIVSAQPKENIPDHVLTEVLNPDTGEYELQDPTHNVTYNDAITGERLSSEEVLQRTATQISFCMKAGACNQQDMKLAKQEVPEELMNYLGLFYYKPETGNKDGVLSVNKNRFDPSQKFLVDGEMKTYCEKREKHCHNPIRYF